MGPYGISQHVLKVTAKKIIWGTAVLNHPLGPVLPIVAGLTNHHKFSASHLPPSPLHLTVFSTNLVCLT